MNHLRLAHLVTAMSNKWMDTTIRLLILEGFLGVQPGLLSRGAGGSTGGLSRTLEKIQERSDAQVDPMWFALTDTGLYMQMIRAARAGGMSQDSAEETVNWIIGGGSYASGPGFLWRVGKQYRDQIAGGAPPALVLPALRKHTKDRSISTLRKKDEHHLSLTQETDEGGDIQRDVPADQGHFMEILADYLSGPGGGAIVKAMKDYFQTVWGKAPGKMAIFDKWIEDPTRKATEIAVMLDKGTALYRDETKVDATYVSRVIRDIQKKMLDFARANAGAFKDMEMHEELSSLGYGTRFASTLRKQARQIATMIRLGGPGNAHQHPNGGGWVADTASVAKTAFVGRNAYVGGTAVVEGNAKVEDNASVVGKAHVSDNARVFGDAEVFGNAKVSGNALVNGFAQVGGFAQVYEDAHVSGEAQVSGTAQVFGSASVFDKAKVEGKAIVRGTAFVGGTAHVYGDATLFDKAKVDGNAKVLGSAIVGGTAHVYEDATLFDAAKVSGGAVVKGNAAVGGNAHVYDNADVDGKAVVSGNAKVYGNAYVSDNALVYEDAKVEGKAIVSGSAQVCGDALVGGNASVYGKAKVFGKAIILKGEFHTGLFSK